MQKALKDLPAFDAVSFREQAEAWKAIVAEAKPGGGRILIEWSTGRGPSCFVYPAAQRSAGVSLCQGQSHAANDERYADFLEFEFVPQVVNALATDGYKPEVICVDLRPLQVQRARRRALEAAAAIKSGSATAAAH